MSFSPKWAALAVALASIAFLVGAAPAGAAIVQQEVNGSQLTVTADDENDGITLSVVNGNIAVNGVETNPVIPADGNAEIVVNSGGGNDTVSANPLVAGTYKSLVLNGGDGDDVLTGGANGALGGINDILNGDADNDTLVGGKGADTVNGGEGDDLMTWNNGDASDVNNGGAGNDEVVINGSPGAEGDVNTYRPVDPVDANNLRVLFARTNLVPFTVNFDAEKLTVNGLAGNDTMSPDAAAQTGLATRTSLTLSGGEGNDSITGGDGADVLNGDLGNDSLTGFKGADTANGGEGDDVMTWNNGDASDVNNGGAGNDEVVINGSPGAEGDVNTYRPVDPVDANNLRVLFARTNLVPFTVNFDAEKLTVNGLAGNDTMSPDAAAQTGLATRTSLTLSGGEGNDSITGGDGADRLVGGKETDTVKGGDGDDLMVWNNGDGSDVNDGDAGVDTVESNGAGVGETYTYETAANNRVLFKRTEGAPAFTIDFTAEKLVANSVGGDDKFEQVGAGVPATQITVNAGEGNDTIKGSEGDDTLNGDADDDTLVGGKGADTAKGGEGDDLMVWNNGDGSDVNDGDAGIDTVESNGNPNAEAYTYEAENGRVLFARAPNAQNAGAFTIDFTAEKLLANSLGGDDTFEQVGAGLLAPLTQITVNAGDGNDTVKGSDGADEIRGGVGADVLNGGAGGDTVLGETENDQIAGGDNDDSLIGNEGNDRLVGDKGVDVVLGGDNDDVVVWNNGDGSEEAVGNAGNDRLEVNGSPAAGDDLKLAPGKFERTNLVPFTITLPNGLGEFEQVSVLSGGGNDTFAVSPGLAGILVSADGGDGNDQLTGSDEADSFAGAAGDDMLLAGAGNDTINGGAGKDLVDGQNGNDQLATRDQESDVVHGGAGTDTAVTDAITVDIVDGVENLDATQLPAPPAPPKPPAPPAPDRVALLPKLGKIAVTASGKKLLAKVPLSCPAAEAGGCRTTLKVETKVGHKVIGSKTVKVAPGGRATASIRLTASAAKLAVNGKLPARIKIATTDAAGNTATKTVPVTLKVPRS